MMQKLSIQYIGPDIERAISTIESMQKRLRFATRNGFDRLDMPWWDDLARFLLTLGQGRYATVESDYDRIIANEYLRSFSPIHSAIRILGRLDRPHDHDPSNLRGNMREIIEHLKMASRKPGHDTGVSELVAHAKNVALVDTLDERILRASSWRRENADPLFKSVDQLDINLPHPFGFDAWSSDNPLLSPHVRAELESLPPALIVLHRIKADGRGDDITVSHAFAHVNPPTDPLERMRLIAEIERRNGSRS